MKIVKLDHIGIAVRNLEEAMAFYVDELGFTATAIEDKPDHGIRIVRLHASNAIIELIEAQDWNRTTQRHLERQGPGVYHIGLEVDDVDAAIAQLLARQVRLIDEIPRQGDDMRVSFIHPTAAGATLVELVTHKKR